MNSKYVRFEKCGRWKALRDLLGLYRRDVFDGRKQVTVVEPAKLVQAFPFDCIRTGARNRRFTVPRGHGKALSVIVNLRGDMVCRRTTVGT